MTRIRCSIGIGFIVIAVCTVTGADWRQFRGPHGLGVSSEKGLPAEWSATKNIVWKVKLPGAGSSSPIVVGNRVFVTCYSGYGLDAKDPGKQEDLRRHLLCVDRTSGKMIWSKEFEPILPEHKYQGEGSYQGYAPSTPLSDGERLYVFFGKSGVFCFDLDGKQIWHQTIGNRTDNWGSGPSPIFYKNLLIINASVEAGALVALDKMTGKEMWKTPKIGSAWNTPVLVPVDKTHELVVSTSGRVVGVDPESGKEIWNAEGVKSYVVPSVVNHGSIVYAIGGGNTSIAVKAGGRGNVDKTHVLWREKKGSNASSPVYHDGHLYYASESGGVIHCQDARTGDIVYAERLAKDAGRIWASPVLADGKLYFVSQKSGTYVIDAAPKFKLVAINVFEDDRSRTNASPAISDGQIFLRTDENLYCIGKK